VTVLTRIFGFCEVTENFASIKILDIGLKLNVSVFTTVSPNELSDKLPSGIGGSGFCGMNGAHFFLEGTSVLHSRVQSRNILDKFISPDQRSTVQKLQLSVELINSISASLIPNLVSLFKAPLHCTDMVRDTKSPVQWGT